MRRSVFLSAAALVLTGAAGRAALAPGAPGALGALGARDCKVAGATLSDYENARGTGNIHMWFDTEPTQDIV